MYKLLVVDDERETRMSICNYFPWAELGFEVVGQAENGKQALQTIECQPVDVVLCDIRMPVMSGVELAKTLHERKIRIKLLFLSGYRDFEYLQQAMQYGARNYLLKPTRYKNLMQAFSQLKIELDNEKEVVESNVSEPPSGDRIINAVKIYTCENLTTVSLNSASSFAHMNPNYFSQYFKKQTGQNFSDYLIEKKMERAAQLLRGIQYKIYEISEMVGYSSSKTFTRMFSRYYGKSPREYRNELGGTE